ncbi:hypothetical protein GcM3_036025 [Golovinomyces cichoracearum]|uniref:Uncharacterized protein n=1 Tax=Golovinomyces cichoracearum TaxID=62708 RepID=A0A420J3F1_9PEZI|nr:hypothetical protein GcM3_036025 [Golovinomyces cichoracearum]
MSIDESESTTPIDDFHSLSSTSLQQSCPDDRVITDEPDPTTLIDDFPPVPPTSLQQSRPNNQVTPDTTSKPGRSLTDSTKINNSILMMKARGLLTLVGPYLEDMEENSPGAGAEFLALISEGVSRAVRGEKIFVKISNNLV